MDSEPSLRRFTTPSPKPLTAPVTLALALILAACGCGGGSSDGGDGGSPDAGAPDGGLPGSSPSRPLNDTGIITCLDYDTDGNTTNVDPWLDCAAVGATITTSGTDDDGEPVPPGQDALFGRDAQAMAGSLVKVGGGYAGFDFTKLDANGDPLAIQDQSYDAAGSYAAGTLWDCVRDNVTGLVWEVKSAGASDLHGNDYLYSWYNSTGVNDGGGAGVSDGGDCLNAGRCDTEKYVEDVNAEGLCGFSDWRLPESEEMLGIVSRARIGGSSYLLDTDYFPNISFDVNAFRAAYWTATPTSVYDDFSGVEGAAAFAIPAFDSATTPLEMWVNKGSPMGARLVRGGVPRPAETSDRAGCNSNTLLTKPDAIYVDNGDGTVTDTETGLVWAKCSLGQSWESGTNTCSGTATNYLWLDALNAVPAINANAADPYLGHTDWRVPSIRELRSLSETACQAPNINTNLFPGTPSSMYWSSSGLSRLLQGVYVIDYGGDWHQGGGGMEWVVAQGPGAVINVRLVRDGS